MKFYTFFRIFIPIILATVFITIGIAALSYDQNLDKYLYFTKIEHDLSDLKEQHTHLVNNTLYYVWKNGKAIDELIKIKNKIIHLTDVLKEEDIEKLYSLNWINIKKKSNFRLEKINEIKSTISSSKMGLKLFLNELRTLNESKLSSKELQDLSNQIELVLPKKNHDNTEGETLLIQHFEIILKKRPRIQSKEFINLNTHSEKIINNNKLIETNLNELKNEELEHAIEELISKIRQLKFYYFEQKNDSLLWFQYSSVILFILIIPLTYLSRKFYNNLIQSESSLKEYKEKIDQITLISETDLRGRIIYVNDKFCKISGYTKEELLGSYHNIVNSGHHEKEFWKDMWRKISAGEIWRGEICNKAKDSSLYWVQSTIFPNMNSKKEIDSYISVRVNITEQKLAEAKTLHTQKLAAIGEIAAGIGHEINNPLTIIKGNIKKIKSSIDSISPEIKDIFVLTEKSIESITNITHGLRTFSRIDSSELVPTDIHFEISSSLNLIQSMMEKSGIAVLTDLRAKDSIIKGNSGKLQQVFMNFLTNARDAIENSLHKEIIIATKNENEHIIISFTDSGTGISDNVKEKIFDPYFTTKGVGKGTGLGLAISANIINEMKGNIDLKTQLNTGTTFTIKFPTIHDKVSLNCLSIDTPVEKISGLGLILDDERGIRMVLKDELEEIGLNVECAADGHEALALLSEKKYDYIFSDLQMPVMNGIDFLKHAILMDNTKFAKIYLISAGMPNSISPEDLDFLNRIASGNIKKPFKQDNILSIIRGVNNEKK